MFLLMRLFHDMAVIPCVHTGCRYWISCCVKLATLTSTSPPPLCLPGLHRFAPSCVLRLKHACLNKAESCSTSFPSPLPESCDLHPCAEDSQCSWGCQNHSIFISTIPSSGSAASSPYLKASISHKHPSTLTHLLFLRFLRSSILVSHKTAARQSYSGLIYHPASSSSPSAQLGLASQPSPSLVLFTVIHSLTYRSRKNRQAVSSSCKSVCWLGSWSSTVPVEDDPVDEDRRDGPGGAAGETEDSHPQHRWVTTTYSTPNRVPRHCIAHCRGLCMFVWNMDKGEIVCYCISCLVRFRPNKMWKKVVCVEKCNAPQ